MLECGWWRGRGSGFLCCMYGKTVTQHTYAGYDALRDFISFSQQDADEPLCRGLCMRGLSGIDL